MTHFIVYLLIHKYITQTSNNKFILEYYNINGNSYYKLYIINLQLIQIAIKCLTFLN